MPRRRVLGSLRTAVLTCPKPSAMPSCTIFRSISRNVHLLVAPSCGVISQSVRKVNQVTIYLSIYPSTYLSIYIPIYLSIYLSVYLSTDRLSIYLPIYLYVYRLSAFIHIYVYLLCLHTYKYDSTHMYVCMSVCLYVCMHVLPGCMYVCM